MGRGATIALYTEFETLYGEKKRPSRRAKGHFDRESTALVDKKGKSDKPLNPPSAKVRYFFDELEKPERKQRAQAPAGPGEVRRGPGRREEQLP